MNTNTTTEKRVAIVTGASSGTGLGITLALLQHGYRVVANSRNISKSRFLGFPKDMIQQKKTCVWFVNREFML
jgi:NAD(P)-dependent dehydrogenase (short-subunit alcohol dehydrogenase family)